MQTRKTRHQFYLPDELSAKLDAMAAQPGSSKTAILTDALTAWFDRRAGHELDQRFGARLDRQNRAADRMEQKLDYLTEALGLFVRHQLTLTAHQPAFDTETQRLGRLRYDAFVELVGRAIARGARPTASPTVNPQNWGGTDEGACHASYVEPAECRSVAHHAAGC